MPRHMCSCGRSHPHQHHPHSYRHRKGGYAYRGGYRYTPSHSKSFKRHRHRGHHKKHNMSVSAQKIIEKLKSLSNSPEKLYKSIENMKIRHSMKGGVGYGISSISPSQNYLANPMPYQINDTCSKV